MKKVLLFIGLSLLFFKSNAQSQNADDDWSLIHKTLNLYIDGQATGDSVMVGRAFHSSWQLKGFREKEFIVVPKSKYLVGYKKRDARPANWSGRVVSVDFTNNAASAKVEISTAKLLFVDYFNLLKTDQGWFIVDKISTRTPHKTVEADVKPKEKS
ncbi:nuclear transport factor 2 family protein [Flavobacterium sp. N502536]|uniref:nuclear transport factor 2 family protein n=1 Tax=Flavobacterium sp. N502536 TaxID=2986837 RepID=UPI0022220F0A|nr:nuclear transport factor 2 family protein [Flavobacterium sp. N502536]